MKFGTDGVRGVAHDELTTEFAARLARAASRVLVDPAGGDPVTTVVIGGDTRESTPAFVDALAEGFTGSGLDVIDLGVVPTPAVAFEAQRRHAIGAMVSASHNPFHDNGIKLFAAGGTKLSDSVQTDIEHHLTVSEASPGDDAARSGSIGRPGSSDGLSHDRDALARYVDHVVSILEGRRLDGLRVALDTANGAAFRLAPVVLRACGAEVVVVADDPDGRNINAECGAMHPDAVARAVRDHAADVGVALDGDADRLIAVDHRGDVVDGDHVIAICAEDLRRRGRLTHDTVVVTVMTNLGFRLAMNDVGIEVVETAVGDRYVLEALADGGYSLGGEQSGHVIFSDHATTGDGLLSAVALLDVVARAGRPLADIAAEAMTSLPQVLVNVTVGERVPDVAEQLADDIRRIEDDLAGTGRVLVRASGTEPLVRVMVEAATEDAARAAAEDLAAVASSRFS